ncbi:hypothetical protein ACFP1H_01840 [Secundilactobacillus hailunensis]|uniref:Uncharacterized protein n=1 Tax=Secundilactobacillus hailunensis TaxID=2559923 RepID=A0ABW1T6N0_9LACO|nr:hypothetical protein [Secundilactobacillus hailunensis]
MVSKKRDNTKWYAYSKNIDDNEPIFLERNKLRKLIQNAILKKTNANLEKVSAKLGTSKGWLLNIKKLRSDQYYPNPLISINDLIQQIIKQRR